MPKQSDDAQPILPNGAVAGNRCNIPAICRIPGRGTAFLVAPGLLLTSLSVVRSKADAARLHAVFFEGGKQDPATVDLKPYQTFFVSAYPEHLRYALVACDTRKILHTKPVKLPLIEKEWADIEEGDVCLVVQHPLPPDAAEEEEDDDDGEEHDAGKGCPDPGVLKTFQEVRRQQGDSLYYFDVVPERNAAGCPVFNSKGVLVGLHSQLHRAEGGGVTSYAVHIREVVKHLFANCKLGLFESQYPADELWRTWCRQGDVLRALRAIQNFQSTDIVTPAAEQLRQHAGDPQKLKEIIAGGGTKVVVDSLLKYRLERGIVVPCIRTLWQISFGDDERRKDIVRHNGAVAVVQCMEKFRDNEEVTEYGCVLLYNLLSLPEHVTTSLSEKCIPTVIKAVETFPHSEVILKFSLGVLVHASREEVAAMRTVELGGVAWVTHALQRCAHNEYLTEQAVLLLAGLAAAGSTDPRFRPCVEPLIAALQQHPHNKRLAQNGNEALWLLGLDRANRVSILRHGGLQVLETTIDAVAQTLGCS